MTSLIRQGYNVSSELSIPIDLHRAFGDHFGMHSFRGLGQSGRDGTDWP